MPVLEYARRLAAEVDGAIGVYLHGSAVLGGFRPDVSDVDILAVVPSPGTALWQRRLGEALRSAAEPCPGTGLEMSVITAATAVRLGRCRFEVHVAGRAGELTVAVGDGHPGDPDLVLHAEVCRRHGVAVVGPPASEVFGAVPADLVRAAMRRELDWAVAHGTGAYAVLNACRALRFAADGRLCSKVDAGEWFLQHATAGHPGHPDRTVVADALAQQRYGRPAPPTHAAVAFVRQIAATIT